MKWGFTESEQSELPEDQDLKQLVLLGRNTAEIGYAFKVLNNHKFIICLCLGLAILWVGLSISIKQ